MKIGIDPMQSLSESMFSAGQQSKVKNVFWEYKIPLLCMGRDSAGKCFREKKMIKFN